MTTKLSKCCQAKVTKDYLLSPIGDWFCGKCGKVCEVVEKPTVNKNLTVPTPPTGLFHMSAEKDREINNALNRLLEIKDREIAELQAGYENEIKAITNSFTSEIKQREATHQAKITELFKELENYQVKTRNGSKIIYGANFNYVKSKYQVK